MTFSLIVDDEYGVPYAARTFETIEEMWEEIHALDGALEHVGEWHSYAIHAMIDQLKQLIHEAENEIEDLPDHLPF